MKLSRLIPVLFFLGLMTTSALQAQKKLTLEDLSLPSSYPAQMRDLQWIAGTNQYSWIDVNKVMVGDPARKEEVTLIDLAGFNDDMEKAGIGRTRRFPAITWMDQNTIRFFYGPTLVTYHTKTKNFTKVFTLPKGAGNTEVEPNTLAAAFTIGDDLFIKTGNDSVQVTFDGGDGIVNGQTVHRNEFGISDGIFWSPKGNFLAFYRKDESMVTNYPLIDIDARIAEPASARYPMAGMTSEQVKVGVYDLKAGKTIFLETGEPLDQFLTNVTWSPDEKSIYIAVLNREQNHMKLNRYNAATGQFELTLFEEKSAMYVEPEHGPLFLPNNPDQFIWQSERNGWNHLYLYDITGKLIKRYTSGNWMVTGIEGFDKSGNILYYYSTEVSPLESHLFQVELRRDRITRITTVNGTHRALPSPDGKYFIDQYSNYKKIATQIDLLDQRGKVVRTLLANEDPLKDFVRAEIEIGTLNASDGTPLYYRMLLPPGFDKSKKYPVFFYLYGGPHNQLISDSWLGGAGLFLTYMAHQGYIVFSLDNRGTANRGFEFESVIHRKLGINEAEDQMKGVEYLKSLPFVDSDRMGIHGWSYGGFMTITMMQKYPGVFKAGVAGGPVIDWKYYEVMYGERYMDTPEENPKGYENASLLNSVDNLDGRLLVIHGDMDDVVVWQHSLAYLKKCVEKRKLVDYLVYPGHGHNVRGADRLHLHMKIEQYMKDHL
ncbi:MAG: DPP IV N-terminal domain-containing protein [Bacteroidales bacterium]